MHKPKRVSHYILKERIGSGSFGQVFRGEDTETHEIRAIKMIMKSNSDNEPQQKALKREIDIMKTLNHQNIVKIYDVIESVQNKYLILEYCSGGDLSKFNSAIGEQQTIVYLRQIISALKIMNEHQVVHRDLKPANILLSEDDQIKIADFGLAREITKESLAKTCVGTPLYMAPEVLRVKEEKGRYSIKADIWSVGTIVYELITGLRPFKADVITDIEGAIQRTIKSPDFYTKYNFSLACIDFLTKIFQIDPNNRIEFDDFCDHPFVIGMPSIKSLSKFSDLDCLNYETFQISQEDAYDFAETAVQIAKNVENPFLLHIKACMLLKPYISINDYNLRVLFRVNFEEAKKFKKKSGWENKPLTQLVLETVVKMCQNHRIERNLLSEHYKQTYNLLKCLKPSRYVIRLKDAIKQQIDDLN